jgi:FdhE protein
MHGTTSSLRTAGGLSATGHEPQLDPAWRPWVRLLDAVLKAADDPKWEAAVPEPVADRPAEAPLLHGSTLHPDARRLRRLVRELLRLAAEVGEGGASLARLRSRRLDAPALLSAAIAHDADSIDRIASEADVEASALGVVARLAATPLLHACEKRLRQQVPVAWMKGYCPICGAWPALAEMRGIERNRRLRCGRCGGDWAIPVLRCPFCDELRHDRLGSLLPESEEQKRRIDVCNTCKGYVKTFTTLAPKSLRSLAMDDLASVELDIAAQERDYARPPHPAYPLAITIERARTFRTLLRRST